MIVPSVYLLVFVITTVNTKEEKITTSPNKIRISNVCENMGVRCINDFQFVEELGIRFS